MRPLARSLFRFCSRPEPRTSTSCARSEARASTLCVWLLALAACNEVAPSREPVGNDHSAGTPSTSASESAPVRTLDARGGARDDGDLRAASVALADAGMATAPDAAPASALPCGVAAILELHCSKCHASTPLFGAPMALASWADLHRDATTSPQGPVYRRILARVDDDARPMPPTPQARLSRAERATLEAWFAEGAPAAPTEQKCAPGIAGAAAETESDAAPTDCENFYELRAHGKPAADDASPYAVSAEKTTEYACFFFAAPYDLEQQGLWFQPIVDNAKIVHHWLLYGIDLAEHTPGAIEGCGADQNGGKTLVAAWAPGSQVMPLPSDVAMELPRKGLFLEFHYANLSGVEQRDRSGVRVCTARKGTRAHTAALHWTGTDGICIDPNSHQEVSGICDPADDQDIHIVNVLPHMHQLGRHLSMTILRKDGRQESLWDGAYDFHNQLFYKVDAVLHPGDRIETRCQYENPTNRQIKWGERTEDEMCYGFATAWPAGALTYDPENLSLIGQLVLPNMPAYRCLDEASIFDSCNGVLDAPALHLTD